MTTTTSGTMTAYDELIALQYEANLLGGTAAVLSWDQEVMMPQRGVAYRSKQLSQIARLQHERLTDPRIGELIAACENDDDVMQDPLSPQAVNVREIRHDYDRKTKLPPELVAEEAELASIGQHTWADARKKKDFEQFRPVLERIVDLLRRKAQCYGWPNDGEPWDALAEDFEPGCTAKYVEGVFAPLRERLQTLIDEIMGAPQKPSDAFRNLKLPIEQQQKFMRFVSESIGFDFDAGRIDVSTHPFTNGSHCNDVRITTRYHEDNVGDALGSTMHECGHGIYEQGLLERHVGTPMGEAVSLGIHESQSRMWENQVGRSIAFWKWCHPKLKDFFGDAVDGLSVEDVYGGSNIVEPGFIRVEADEATYNMHPLIRFEIERAILAGDMEVGDIPDAWNAKYKQYLNLDVPDDAKGCLQDIHWSMAAMGYFPTYTLGNLYAAQLFEQILADMPDINQQFERGEFTNLKAWLNEKIHAHGRRFRAADLCEHVTGRPLSADPLMRHLEGKFRPLYGI
jgi:carboxypeptidase Taq